MATLRHPPQQLAYAKSKHGYTAQNTDELDFPKGALLQIVNQRDPDWWEGIYNQKQGWLPSSYVKLLKVRSKSVDNKLESKAELLEKRKSKDDSSYARLSRSPSKNESPKKSSPKALNGHYSGYSQTSSNSSPNQRYIYSTHTQSKYAAIANQYDTKKQKMNQKDILRELL